MIIWLNGPFGVGKTTVALELLRLIPGARIADPERIGYVMKRTSGATPTTKTSHSGDGSRSAESTGGHGGAP